MSKKIRFFQKIGFLTGHRCQKNPIFSKNRIFNGYRCQKKIRFFQKIGFLTGIGIKKIRFFQKIGFLTGIGIKKNPIFSKNRIFNFIVFLFFKTV
jgi:DNA-binding transcriptional MerR regulator